MKNNLMPLLDKMLLPKRFIIETLFDQWRPHQRVLQLSGPPPDQWAGRKNRHPLGGGARRCAAAQLPGPHRQVCRFANALKDLGVGKGDLVALYMPMVPEAAITMLACARLGAPHSIAFGGFRLSYSRSAKLLSTLFIPATLQSGLHPTAHRSILLPPEDLFRGALGRSIEMLTAMKNYNFSAFRIPNKMNTQSCVGRLLNANFKVLPDFHFFTFIRKCTFSPCLGIISGCFRFIRCIAFIKNFSSILIRFTLKFCFLEFGGKLPEQIKEFFGILKILKLTSRIIGRFLDVERIREYMSEYFEIVMGV